MATEKYNIFWFRRDLRLDDNIGLLEALKENIPVLPIFIFDTEILRDLPKDDARVTFIHQKIQEIRKELQDKYNSSMAIYQGKPIEIFKELLQNYSINAVYTNRDYEPYAQDRDAAIKELLQKDNIDFHLFKDQVIFEKDEIVKKDGDPYLVYTPYMKKWKTQFDADKLQVHYTTTHLDNVIKNTRLPNLSLSDVGFKKSSIEIPDYDLTPSLIDNYENTRNIPSKEGTSRLGVHLRFGTIGIRKVIKKAANSSNKTFLEELIWREFFMQILYHFPETLTEAFKKKYDNIKWRNNKDEFEQWKNGKTGFALVDAGMRQLNQTGFMHNRVRMVVGSFLTKHLLIDWRWGEAYFAEKLLDYEMASNVGNWQWVAGSGVDSMPYFRIFNPNSQLDKFDKNREYVKHWIDEYNTNDYPDKMIDHKTARERCLKEYKKAVKS